MTITVRGADYALHPPKRRIYIAEVARALGTAQERALSACLGLSARSLWSATRREPAYRGDPLDYGEAVYEALSDAGWTPTEIVLAGLEAWKGWSALIVSDAAVKDAEDFTAAPAEATSGSAVISS